MKKEISTVFVVLMLLSIVLAVPVFAKNPVELKLTNTTVYADDEFEIKVFISDNSQLSGAVIDLQYDANMLEFISGDKGGIVDESAMVSIKGVSENSAYKYVRFTYLSPNSAITSEGILFSVKFKALPNAEGQSDIKISIPSAGDFVNSDAEKIAYKIENSKVKIINTTIESTGETVSTSIVSETNMFESTNDVSESSINNANVDFENNENDYVKIVIGLFIAGGIIIIGVIVYMINKKKKEVV